jgi:hypothetical protein
MNHHLETSMKTLMKFTAAAAALGLAGLVHAQATGPI